MAVTLKPVNDENRDAVIALSVREDQPFVAPNDYSLEQAAESNREHPGVAHAYGIYADDRLVGFAMFIFAPEDEYPDDPDDPEEQYGEEDRYYLWRFMIDQHEQGKGYGQAALAWIIQYFKDHGAHVLYLSTEPDNELGLHVYHKLGFRETGEFEEDEAILKLEL